MNLIEILSILGIHWIADFVFQDEKWALGKSKNWNDLLSHTITYSSFWFFISLFLDIYTRITTNKWLFEVIDVQLFVLITFICHTTTDYFTSRLNFKLYIKGKFGSSIPNLGFFTSIGFDQYLHYIQLFLTSCYLTK